MRLRIRDSIRHNEGTLIPWVDPMTARKTMLAGLFTVGSLLAWLSTAQTSQTAGAEGADLQHVLATHADDLATLTNDDQALTLFTSRLGPALDLKESIAILSNAPAHGTKDESRVITNEAAKRATRFVRDLAAWRISLGLLAAAEKDSASLDLFLRDTEPQLAWVMGENESRLLTEAWPLAKMIATVPDPASGKMGSSSYGDYAAAIDRAALPFTGSGNSWLAIGEQEGIQGILTRLRDMGGQLSNGERDAFPNRYFHERLRPVLTAHLIARTIRAESEAERLTRDRWLQLRNLRDSLREQRGLARLCGAWQWTIHNHQNHGEHKMIMVFPSPGTPPGAGPRPAKTVVLGDTVYLRWEFDRGIVQEDSLLFSGEGRRLEGTFVNSGGAWGGITAKRTAPCVLEGAASAPTGSGDQGSSLSRGKSSHR